MKTQRFSKNNGLVAKISSSEFSIVLLETKLNLFLDFKLFYIQHCCVGHLKLQA